MINTKLSWFCIQLKIYLAKIKKRISKIQLVSRLSQLAHARSFGLDYVACSSLGALCSLKPCKTDSQLANNLWRKLLSSRNRDRPRLKPHLLHASGQTHYKMISCNIWLPVVIHRSKTRNNALDVFWGIETIIMPLSRQPQKKSFCPVSHSLAPTFMNIFFIMRLSWGQTLFLKGDRSLFFAFF